MSIGATTNRTINPENAPAVTDINGDISAVDLTKDIVVLCRRNWYLVY
jgi:hypothetical protein